MGPREANALSIAEGSFFIGCLSFLFRHVSGGKRTGGFFMKKPKKYILKTFLIAGGNSTLLAWNYPARQKLKLIKDSLNSVEQVGFVEDNTLNMMGDELCINATIALASQLSSGGFLYTSGIEQPVRYINSNRRTTIRISASWRKEKNVILLPGIGFFCSFKKILVSKRLLSSLAYKYSLPAFGVAIYENNQLTPFVYVKQTNSIFKESACGSGSIAIYAITGIQNIKQTTGEIISISANKDMITISAEVTEITNNLNSQLIYKNGNDIINSPI
jgi:hypothetical protein